MATELPATPSSVPMVPLLVGPDRVLDHEELTDIIDLCLWTGQILLENGASAPRVEQTVERVGSALGCDHLDILVSPNVIMATTTEGKDFRTKARRINEMRVNLSRIVEVTEVARAVTRGHCSRVKLRARLESIESHAPPYPHALHPFAVGLACAAFCRIFHGDWPACGVALIGATVAMAVRQQLIARRVHMVIHVCLTSFVAGLIATLGGHWTNTHTPEHALAASVLMLIPGVALMNAFEELVRGYSTMALSRGAQGLLVTFSIALGLLLAMSAVGSSVL